MDSAITVSADSSPGNFEGPEKLLELWFAPDEQQVTGSHIENVGGRKGKAKWTGLRSVERSVWDSMLDEVQCKVLSVIEGEDVDAYLLSESSMFVWPHKLILKTCGTTTLLLGLPTLLRIASETCGLTGVWRCFYSRKTFMFPDRQRGPHKDWNQEMAFLDKLFENASAYTVGKMNGDHWLLYLTPPQDDVLQPNALASSSALPPTDPSTPLASLTASLSSTALSSTATSLPHPPQHHLRASTPLYLTPNPPFLSRPDQTLEILMSKLHPSVCASFYHPSSSSTTPYTSPLLATSPLAESAHGLGSALSAELGINQLFPDGTQLDSFLFSPCGYSANAIKGDRYATIHVTPEVDYSYASFETNLEFVGESAEGSVESEDKGPRSLQDLVERVLEVFKPEKLSCTLFLSVDEEDDEHSTSSAPSNGTVSRQTKSRREQEDGMKNLLSKDLLRRYERVDRILYEFEGYSLVYAVWQMKETGSSLGASIASIA